MSDLVQFFSEVRGVWIKYDLLRLREVGLYSINKPFPRVQILEKKEAKK